MFSDREMLFLLYGNIKVTPGIRPEIIKMIEDHLNLTPPIALKPTPTPTTGAPLRNPGESNAVRPQL